MATAIMAYPVLYVAGSPADHRRAFGVKVMSSRKTYVLRDGELVPKYEQPLPRLHTISDTMEPLRHMSNGKMYDSKSRFRDETRARGLTEVGNEKWPQRQIIKNSPVAPDMKRMIDYVTPMSHGEFREFMDKSE